MRVTYHPPDPRVGPRCDVCFFGAPDIKYACEPFSVRSMDGRTILIIGAEGITACPDCSADLDIGESRLPDLETRAIEGFGAMGQAHFKKLQPWIHNLHHGMMRHLGAKV